MATATLRGEGLSWTAADDEAVRQLFEAPCSSTHELAPQPNLAHLTEQDRRLSVFNCPETCLNPKVDQVTGEILFGCRSRQCLHCAKTECIRMSFRVMRANPTHEFTLTCIGLTPDEWKTNEKRFLRLLRKLSPDFEWFRSVEVSAANHDHVHVHGFAKGVGQITQAQFQAAATNAGLGRVHLQKVRADRQGLAKHYAYPMKSLDSTDATVRSEYLRWNAYGSKTGFWSYSRGFFKTPDERESTDLVEVSEATQEPSETDRGSERWPNPDDEAQTISWHPACRVNLVRPNHLIARLGHQARQLE